MTERPEEEGGRICQVPGCANAATQPKSEVGPPFACEEHHDAYEARAVMEEYKFAELVLNPLIEVFRIAGNEALMSVLVGAHDEVLAAQRRWRERAQELQASAADSAP